MDLAAVFILSLLGGYFFAHEWKRTAYSTQRSDGHHLYFRAAGYGVLLLILAYALREWLTEHSPYYSSIDHWLVGLIKPTLKEELGVKDEDLTLTARAEWVIASGLSFVLGPLLARIANSFTPRKWAVRKSAKGFDKIFVKAQDYVEPVMLTLTTGKTYIGMVTIKPDHTAIPTVTIRPAYSGFRDSEGKLTITTNYNRLFDQLKHWGPQQFGVKADWVDYFDISIKLELVSTANLFNPDVYTTFNPNWYEDLVKRGYPPPEPRNNTY